MLCSARSARAHASRASLSASVCASVRSAAPTDPWSAMLPAPPPPPSDSDGGSGMWSTPSSVPSSRHSRSMAQSVRCRLAFSSSSMDTSNGVPLTGAAVVAPWPTAPPNPNPPAAARLPAGVPEPTDGSEACARSLVESAAAAMLIDSRPCCRSLWRRDWKTADASRAPVRTYAAYAAAPGEPERGCDCAARGRGVWSGGVGRGERRGQARSAASRREGERGSGERLQGRESAGTQSAREERKGSRKRRATTRARAPCNVSSASVKLALMKASVGACSGCCCCAAGGSGCVRIGRLRGTCSQSAPRASVAAGVARELAA
jgi:hypothetical protein